MRAALILALSLSGCATLPSVDWAPEPFPRVVLPELPAPKHDGEAVETAPGRVELDGVVLDWLLDVEGEYDPAREALGVCYDGREQDREEARAIMQALEAQRREARLGQWRAGAVGAGVGGVAVFLAVLGLLVPR